MLWIAGFLAWLLGAIIACLFCLLFGCVWFTQLFSVVGLALGKPRACGHVIVSSYWSFGAGFSACFGHSDEAYMMLVVLVKFDGSA